MKIGFEAQLLLDRHKTGIGWCAVNLIQNLAAMEGHSASGKHYDLPWQPNFESD